MLARFASSGTGGGVLIRAPGIRWGLGGNVPLLPLSISKYCDYKGLKVLYPEELFYGRLPECFFWGQELVESAGERELFCLDRGP